MPASNHHLDDPDETPPKKVRGLQGGRRKGIPNYNKGDVNALLDGVERVLPLGQLGWNDVEAEHNVYSTDAGRPARSAKSLETKFKQVCCLSHSPCSALT